MEDPAVFPDGKSFKPERFVGTTDPRLSNHRFGCFGFGRRICPGMHVALQSLYLVIARYTQLSYCCEILVSQVATNYPTQDALGI